MYIYIYICIHTSGPRERGRSPIGDSGFQEHTCRILPPSEIDGGAVFGCVYRLRREIPISQNWLKGQNMATMFEQWELSHDI